jgi:nicotinate-nucleotide adenylyltransferase
VLACHYALLRWNLQKVLVVPSFKHPFNKPLPQFEDRLAMCEIAFSYLGDYAEISDIERQMGGVSYTVDTVRELMRRSTAERFRLLVGGDILPDTRKWRVFDELVRLAPMLIIPRMADGEVLGGGSLEGALPDVSSTAVRRHLSSGGAGHGAVPAKVLDYIRENGLYQLPDEQDGL